MKRLAILTLVLAVGFGLGWITRFFQTPLYYETKIPTAIQIYPHGVVGILPQGTVVESGYKLAQHSDVGSTACLRIVFGGTPVETEELLQQVSRKPPRVPTPTAGSLGSSGLHPGARFDIEGPSVIKPGDKPVEEIAKPE